MSAPSGHPEAKPTQERDEMYAHSLSTIQRVGEQAVLGAMEGERESLARLLRDDFETGAIENLRTTEDIETCLDIERTRVHQVVGGQARAVDGTPMVDIVERGHQAALAASATDERMSRQAHRDEGDLIIATRADTLQPGQLLLTVSLPPLEGLARDPKFWGDLGYRPDLAYIQTYYKSEDGETMLAGSYSVGRCDPAAWRRVLQGFGVTVPTDASADDFIRSYQVFTVTPAAAQGMGQRVRAAYYREIGDVHQRQSVTEYVEAQRSVVTQYFERYLLPLAEAVYTGENRQPLRDFAWALLDTSAMCRFNPEVVREVMRVANSRDFPRSAGPVMENLIRYALVERLREGLVAVVGGAEIESVRIHPMIHVPPDIMLSQMAHDVNSGVSVGRSYGGCASLVLDTGSADAGASPQEAYGGRKDGKEGWVWKIGTCRVKDCPSPNPTKVGPCSVCERCQTAFDAGLDPTRTGAQPWRRATAQLGKVSLFTKPRAKRVGSENGDSGRRKQSSFAELLAA